MVAGYCETGPDHLVLVSVYGTVLGHQLVLITFDHVLVSLDDVVISVLYGIKRTLDLVVVCVEEGVLIAKDQVGTSSNRIVITSHSIIISLD